MSAHGWATAAFRCKGTPGQGEILGWWIIPIGLVAGTLLIIATTRFVRWMLRFAARRPVLAAA